MSPKDERMHANLLSDAVADIHSVGRRLGDANASTLYNAVGCIEHVRTALVASAEQIEKSKEECHGER